MKELLVAAKAPTTWASYNRSINSFKQFHLEQYGVNVSLPYTPHAIAAFVSYLDLKQLAPATISTTLSAIAYFHKINNFPDPTSNYLVRQVQQGGKRTQPAEDARQPITRLVLNQIHAAVPALATTPYMVALYQSLFLISYHAFLRVGEVTQTGMSTQHILTMDQVDLQSIPSSLTITFKSYKHSKGKSTKISIPYQSHPCPVQSFIRFLSFRGKSPGFIFITPNGTLLTRHQFHQFLSLSLKYAGFNSTQFNTHSFRIGAATDAAARGLSPLQIMDMGRWKSDAFLKYIRQPVVSMP